MKEFINVTAPLIEELKRKEACPPNKPCRPHVLIVEDNPIDADLMQKVLSAMGCEVKVVEDAYKAMNVLSQEFFPLLFLDLRLPVIHGTELLRTIRDKYPKTHTIIVTGTLDSWSSAQLAEIGGYAGLVHKPLLAEDVQEILEKHNFAR